MKWLTGYSKKREVAKGFSNQQSRQTAQTFILEPILTPSGILDGGDDTPDPLMVDWETNTLPEVDTVDNDTEVEDVAQSDISETNDDLDADINPKEIANNTLETDISDEDLETVDFIENLGNPESEAEEVPPQEATESEILPVDSPKETDDSEVEVSATANNADVEQADNTEIEITNTSDTNIDEIDETNLQSVTETETDSNEDSSISDSANEVNEIDTTLAGGQTDETPEIIVDDLSFSEPNFAYNSGVFTVGETGEVGIDFLFDGGKYKGELAIFSLEGMDEFEPGAQEFIKEATSRALSNSELGYVVISDASEGAKFSGNLGENNFNSGTYSGVKTFAMRPGDTFAVMLVPNGKVEQVFNNPGVGGAVRPLFSLVTSNPNDAFHVGQIADVTGDGNTFVMEDVRVDSGSDRDYNDIIFQVRGARGNAALMDDVVASGKDWRGSDLGQALIEYAKVYVTPDPLNLDSTLEDLISDLDSLLDDEDLFEEELDLATNIGLEDESFAEDDVTETVVEQIISVPEQVGETSTEEVVVAEDETTVPDQVVETSTEEVVVVEDETTVPDQVVETSTEEVAVVKDETAVPDQVGETSIEEVAVVKDETAVPDQVVETSTEEVVVVEQEISSESEAKDLATLNLIYRLENLTQTLKFQTNNSDFSSPISVTPALIERLETLTETLQNQTISQPISENTLALVTRLETMVEQTFVPVPVTSPTLSFAATNQPLVGIIDTGFSGNNPDIDYSQIIWGRDHIDGDNDPRLASGEGNEHGTHVLGLIAAQKDNGIGIDGINPDAPIWAGRAIGSGKWAESLVEFVDAAKESGQPNAVVNLSLDLTQVNPDGSVTTRYEFTPMERAAIEYARQNGIVLVVAAGNDGDVMSALGQASLEFDNIITVGAAEQFNPTTSVWQGADRTYYSSYGYGLDITAFGGTMDNPVLSLSGDSVATVAGTSVATAKVTGVVSQVWAANPELSYRQVIEIIKNTATDLGLPGWDMDTGAGLLNMTAAIHLAKATQKEDYAQDLQFVPLTWSGEGLVTPIERAANPNSSDLGFGQITTNSIGEITWDSFLAIFGGSLSPAWQGFVQQLFDQFYANNGQVIPDNLSVDNLFFQVLRGMDNRVYTRYSPDGNAWSAWAKTNTPNEVTYTQPVVATLNGVVYESVTGKDQKIYTRSSTDGINWSEWKQANVPNEATTIKVAMVAFNGKLYQSHVGKDHKIYTRSSSDGVNWTAWTKPNIPNEATVDAVAMAEFNGRLYQSSVGKDLKVYTRSSSDGINWTAWTKPNIPNEATNHSIAMVAFNGKLYQSSVGRDNRVYTRYSTNGTDWSAWERENVPNEQTFDAPWLATFGDKLYQYIVGKDTHVYMRSSTDGSNWTQWERMGTARSPFPNIKLKPGTRNLDFSRGQEWVTSTGYKFRFQQDGNLVLYNSQGRAIWATGTFGTNVDRFSVQADGNIVLYERGKAVWATDTAGNPGAYFSIQNDGNLVVYTWDGKPLFNTGTNGGKTGTFTASKDWLNKHGNSGGSGNYLNGLVSWSDWQWEDSINSAADLNYIKSHPNSDIGKLYRDLSNDLLGQYFPPSGAYISDDYNNAVTYMNSYHGGIDIGGAGINNQPVKSLVNGTVVLSTSNFGTLTILGEDGRYYIYKHLSSRYFSNGQKVTKGQVIGRVGTVGANGATGVFAPHLHFEVSRPPYTYGAAHSPSVLSSKAGIRQRNYNPLKAYWELRR